MIAKVFAQFSPKAATPDYDKWVGPHKLIETESLLHTPTHQLCTTQCNYVGTLPSIDDLGSDFFLQPISRDLHVNTHPTNINVEPFWDRAGLQHCHIAIYVEEADTLFGVSGWLQQWKKEEGSLVFACNVRPVVVEKS